MIGHVNFLNIIFGLVLIVTGIMLVIAKTKALMNNTPNSLGGQSSLLICGIGMVISGIILIVKSF